MRFRDLLAMPGRPGLFLHPEVRGWIAGLPRPAQGPGTAGGHGRGEILRVREAGLMAVIKRCRRGGLLAPLLPDAFLSARRAVQEVRALERLSAAGISPRCLGLQVEGRILRRMILAVEEVAGAADLLEHARRGEPDALGLARSAGRAVRAMHEAGVGHRDLNASNVLARRDGAAWRAWIIDFDGARLFAGPVPIRRRAAEALRLCRSLDRRASSAATGALARRAFLVEALPPGLARPVLRRARRRHAWRAALRRRPREE